MLRFGCPFGCNIELILIKLGGVPLLWENSSGMWRNLGIYWTNVVRVCTGVALIRETYHYPLTPPLTPPLPPFTPTLQLLCFRTNPTIAFNLSLYCTEMYLTSIVCILANGGTIHWNVCNVWWNEGKSLMWHAQYWLHCYSNQPLSWKLAPYPRQWMFLSCEYVH